MNRSPALSPPELSALDPATLLENLGATECQGSKPTHRSRQFKLGGVKYGVTGPLWVVDDGSRQGGRGAISLYMRVAGCGYVEAVHALAGVGDTSFSHQALARAVAVAPARPAAPPTPVALPTPDPTAWSAVRNYLTERRCLDAGLVAELHGRGVVYACRRSPHANVTFKCVGHGVMQRGTSQDDPFRRNVGAAAEAGPFVAGPANARTYVVVEAPIDALSVLTLARRHGRPEPRVIAHGGNFVAMKALVSYLPSVTDGGRVVYAGQDADEAGRQFATDLQAVYPSACRLEPTAPHKDWNDVLVAEIRGA